MSDTSKLRANLRRHTIKRAKQRYGVKLEMQDIATMRGAIKKRAYNTKHIKTKAARKATKGVATHWEVYHKGILFYVIYNELLQEVATVYPPRCLHSKVKDIIIEPSELAASDGPISADVLSCSSNDDGVSSVYERPSD